MKYSTTDLNEAAYQVREDLNSLFHFGRKVSGVVFDINERQSRGLMKMLYIARGFPIDYADRAVQALINGETAGQCQYTADIDQGRTDYMVFVSGVSEKTPLILGEEITHGEHQTYHTRRNRKRSPKYATNFGEAAVEFLGFLGMLHVANNLNGATLAFYRPRINEQGMSQEDLNHYIGYLVAKQVSDAGSTPSRELFHAESQVALWEQVNGIIRPKIHMGVPAEYVGMAESQVRDYLELIGLKADVEITAK